MSWAHIVGQKKQIEVLRRAVQTNRLASAYLFIGQDGVGKDAVALELAKVLNCLADDALQRAEACDQCESCRQFAELMHPNLEYVFPIEGAVIKDISEASKEREKQESALAQYKQLFAEKRRNPYFKMQMEKSMGIVAEPAALCALHSDHVTLGADAPDDCLALSAPAFFCALICRDCASLRGKVSGARACGVCRKFCSWQFLQSPTAA
jgi:hypothetical protein